MASEEERGQTGGLRTTGVEGLRNPKITDPNVLVSTTEDGDSPVGEGDNRAQDPEYRGTREILWEAGGTTPQA